MPMVIRKDFSALDKMKQNETKWNKTQQNKIKIVNVKCHRFSEGLVRFIQVSLLACLPSSQLRKNRHRHILSSFHLISTTNEYVEDNSCSWASLPLPVALLALGILANNTDSNLSWNLAAFERLKAININKKPSASFL